MEKGFLNNSPRIKEMRVWQGILNHCQIGSGKIEHLVNFSKPGIIRKDVCFFCCITFPWMNIELSQRCGYLPTGNTSCDVSLGIGSRGFGLQGSVGSRHLSASFKTSARRDARQM